MRRAIAIFALVTGLFWLLPSGRAGTPDDGSPDGTQAGTQAGTQNGAQPGTQPETQEGIQQSRAQELIAPTPPMGWNSWDSYAMTVDEAQFKANAEWLNQHLKRYGWRYVVVDAGWYISNPASGGKPEWQFTLGRDGRYLPAPNRFPSAGGSPAAEDPGAGTAGAGTAGPGTAGFRPLADYVHSLGLRFGIHIMRGIPRKAVEANLPIAGSSFHAADAAKTGDTCRWNADNYGVRANAAGQAYYDSLATLYAGWGVDLVKIDCIAAPYKTDEIHMFSRALRKTGRPIVLSLSPGPTPIADANDVRNNAEMWRISDDVWDEWEGAPGKEFPASLKRQFALAARWAAYTEAGHWPDADMLPLGHLGPSPGYGPARDTKLTRDEQRTMLTLWAISRSPLMMGGNLTQMDPFTTSLLTNPEVLAVDQLSNGNRPVLTTAGVVGWLAKPSAGAGSYLAIFNLGDEAQPVEHAWRELGLSGSSYKVRDLWERKNLGRAGELKVTLQPHASVLYRVSAR